MGRSGRSGEYTVSRVMEADGVMSQADGNALDRYIGMADSAVRGTTGIEEWTKVFAPDAVVVIFAPQAVRGHAAITDFYRGSAAGFAETKHFWTSEVLPDGSLRANWAAVCRTPEGTVFAVSGVEHAEVDAEGRITSLHNEFTVPPPPPAGSA